MVTRIVGILLFLGIASAAAVVLHAQETTIFDAVRAGNARRVATILRRHPSAAMVRDDEGRTPLHLAAMLGSERIVSLLLARNADVAATDDDGRQPLHLAVMGRHGAIVSLLLRHGANVEAQDEHWMTPVERAVESGDRAIVRLLTAQDQHLHTLCRTCPDAICVAAGRGDSTMVGYLLTTVASPNVAGSLGVPPVFHAARGMHRDVVMQLVRAGARVDAVTGFDASTILHWLAAGPDNVFDSVLVDFVLASGLDVNATDARGRTPLHIAVGAGAYRCMVKLLQQGALVDWPIASATTNLQQATILGDTTSLELLIRHGAVLDARNAIGRTALHVAAATRGAVGVAAILLAHGAKVNLRDAAGAQPLHLAAVNDNPALIELLLRAGADPNAIQNDGCTPLHLAAREPWVSLEICDQLLAKGADPGATNVCGETPLGIALEQAKQSWASRLMHAGVDVTRRDCRGRTLLHYAAMSTDSTTVRILLATGAAVDAADNLGRTPLHYAVASGNLGSTRLLLASGASPGIRDTSGATPLHQAVFGGAAVTELLLSSGADYSVCDHRGRTPLAIAVAPQPFATAERTELLNSSAACLRRWGAQR